MGFGYIALLRATSRARASHASRPERLGASTPREGKKAARLRRAFLGGGTGTKQRPRPRRDPTERPAPIRLGYLTRFGYPPHSAVVAATA
jgi:hypothetical protein